MEKEISKIDNILKEIKASTGWSNIAATQSGYVITFNESDAHQIRGLSKNDSTFFLEFESLATVPICFHVIRHRIGGPAEEAVSGYTMDETSYSSHTKEEFKRIEMEWWIEGIRSNGLDGIPIWACVEDGWYCKNKATGLLDWPDTEWPEFYAKKVKIDWSNPRGRIIEYGNRTDITDDLRPLNLIAVNMAEEYIQGKLNTRMCEFFQMDWARGVNELNSDNNKIILFNGVIKTELLTGLNLWNGNLLGDAETEMILLSEFNRIYNSEKLD